MSGWIKIHRSILNHWVYSDPKYLQWWITILIEVNHKPEKVLIKGKLFDCNQGESVKSLETWSTIFRCTKKTVKRFFELLEKDQMITIKNLHVSTRLSVCNYKRYQTVVNEDYPAHYPAHYPQTRMIKNDKEKTIDEIYHSYPTKDPKTGRSTGKCSKDKLKIEKLLQTLTEEDLAFRINNYLENCNMSNTYLKNFSVLLNNLPEPVENLNQKKKRILQ